MESCVEMTCLSECSLCSLKGALLTCLHSDYLLAPIYLPHLQRPDFFNLFNSSYFWCSKFRCSRKDPVPNPPFPQDGS